MLNFIALYTQWHLFYEKFLRTILRTPVESGVLKLWLNYPSIYMIIYVKFQSSVYSVAHGGTVFITLWINNIAGQSVSVLNTP